MSQAPARDRRTHRRPVETLILKLFQIGIRSYRSLAGSLCMYVCNWLTVDFSLVFYSLNGEDFWLLSPAMVFFLQPQYTGTCSAVYVFKMFIARPVY